MSEKCEVISGNAIKDGGSFEIQKEKNVWASEKETSERASDSAQEALQASIRPKQKKPTSFPPLGEQMRAEKENISTTSRKLVGYDRNSISL